MMKTENYNKMQKAKHSINYLIIFISSLVLLSCALEGVNNGNTIRRPSSTVPLIFAPVYPYANPLWQNADGTNNNRLQFSSDELGGTVIEIKEVTSFSQDRRPVPCFLHSTVELDSGGEGFIEMVPNFWEGTATGVGDLVFLEITGTNPNGEEVKLDGSFRLRPIEIINPAEIESVTVNDNDTDDPVDDTVSPDLILLSFEVRGINPERQASVTILSSYGSLDRESDVATDLLTIGPPEQDDEGNDVYKINISYHPKPVSGTQEVVLSFDLPVPELIEDSIETGVGDSAVPVQGCAAISSIKSQRIERRVSIVQRAALPQPTTPTTPQPGG